MRGVHLVRRRMGDGRHVCYMPVLAWLCGYGTLILHPFFSFVGPGWADIQNSSPPPHSTARFPVQLLAIGPRSLARTSLAHRSPEAELELQVYP